ncbi:MAG: restriction endonuclease subunit S [Sterolibacterium sp.]|nr:restriction endonuclease subunit S [Sterolibacterium sp.]
MSSVGGLPQTWCDVRIFEITSVNPTLDKAGIPDDLEVSFVPMSAVQTESGIIDVSDKRKFSEVKKGYTPFLEGDVLFAKITPCMENGKMAVVPEVRNGIGFGSTEFHVLRALSGVNAKFVYYYVSSQGFRREAEHNMSGAVGQRRVTTPYLTGCEVPFPPTNEQHRIVAKIEELFSELDKGIENLKTARAQLKVYRQALLKHAFEGRLTARWREENPDKLETADALLKRIQQERAQHYQQQLADWQASGGSKPKAPKPLPPLTAEELAELPELPQGWVWTRLGNANVEVSDGPFGSNLKSSDYVDSGVRVIRLENIGALEFIEEKESYVTEEKYELLKKHTVSSGDIIFSSFITENVRVALLPPSIQKAINKADCFCVRFSGETISNVFVVMFLSTRHVYKQLEALIHGVGRPRINTTQLKDVVIPVCSAVEQQVMIAEIESRLSAVNQLDQTITASLQQAESLRQSILKKAFSGQLVAQDANDEPASVLLARIKAESAAQAAMAKQKKPQKAQTQPAPTKTNVIPFPVKIADISTTDLHAGILARAYQHHEHAPKYLAYFGHVKAEKIAHLVEAHLGIDLGREPVKAAAGPNDYPRLKKVESRAQKANWFNVHQQKDGGAYVFAKAHGFDDLLGKTGLALGDRAAAVDELMQILLPLNTRQVEIVATLYAAWNNLLLLGRSPGDDDIVHEARENWHASKLGIEREKFLRGLEWMRCQGLVPSGKGRYVPGKDKSFEANV